MTDFQQIVIVLVCAFLAYRFWPRIEAMLSPARVETDVPSNIEAEAALARVKARLLVLGNPIAEVNTLLDPVSVKLKG